MPENTPRAAGADLARQALAAAKAAAKTRPTGPVRKTRRTTLGVRGRRSDPMGLGQIIERLKDQQGWESGIDGGNLLEQWPTICPPELATTVQPAGYDPDQGLLTLRPSSNAYATRVRLYERQLVEHLNERFGRPAVRAIRVLPPGGTAASSRPVEEAVPEPGPVRTRESASSGYRRTFEAHQAAKADSAAADPRIGDAIDRQNRILADLRNREPEAAFTDAVAELERLTAPAAVDRSEQIRLAAIARKRAGDTAEPRRALDVA